MFVTDIFSEFTLRARAEIDCLNLPPTGAAIKNNEGGDAA